MTSKKLLPIRYCGSSGNASNYVCVVGHLTLVGFIFPKHKHYEYKENQ